MKNIISRALLVCSIILSVITLTNAQSRVFYYWDFNNTIPKLGAGGDSLGTQYSYSNTYTTDTTNKSAPLYAPYSRLGINSAYILYTRPAAKQTTPLVCTLRDSIVDNGNGPGTVSGSFPIYPWVNDLPLLGNDTASNESANEFIRARNPCENTFMYLHMPTTGYSNVVFNYAISASSTKGARYNIFSYSTNGGSTWNNLTRAMDTFNIGGVYRPDTLQMINPTTAISDWYGVHIDFSSDPNINNNPNFVLRWQYAGPSSNATSGNSRYDNFSLAGDSSCPGIILNPVNQIACYSGNAVFLARASGSGYILNWQVSTNGGTSYDTIGNGGIYSGAHNDSLVISGATSAMTGYLYQCAVVVPSGACATTFSSAASLTVDPYLSDSITTSTNITCIITQGNATVGVSGGTPPYTYLWSDPSAQATATASGLSAGIYSITVTDNVGCAGTHTVTIASANVPHASISSQANIECTGAGSATGHATSGLTPYTYSWNDPGTQTTATAIGLSAGAYTITVTDNNGCVSTAATTILNVTPVRDSIIGLGVYKVIHYWDFNQTFPFGGGGLDSLGTVYSYANNYTTDTTNKSAPLTAPYSLIPSGNPRIVFERPTAKQTGATKRDSILDNGSQGSFVNDLPLLGNDTVTNATNNLFVRSRNPDLNSAMYIYMPTTGYKNIQLNYAISASSTKGAFYNVFSYSTNGGSTWQALTAAMDTFNTSGHSHPDSLQMINSVTGGSGWYPVHINFSSDPNVNNNANFILKWTFVGSGSNGTSGNDRYDNFSVSGYAPEEQCYGDNNFSVNAAVKYGSAPFTYAWTPNIGSAATENNVSAGTYSVTVTDASGCSASSTFVVTQPTLLTASISGSTGSCYGGNNGTATASGSGGVSPYVYSWSAGGQTSTTATGLSAGTYTVTVSDIHQCTATTSVTINQPSAGMRDSISSTNNGCGPGSAIVGVKNGAAPYTYLWTGGTTTASINGLNSGTYTVTITDNNGCSVSASATVTQSTAIRDSITHVVGRQVVVHYWDFNNTLPGGGTGGDSLGTGTYPLPAQYSLLASANPKIFFSRPSAKQTTPLVCTLRDSILDNGSGAGTGSSETYPWVNDLHILGNDTSGSESANLFIRSRNPDENSYVYLNLPTTGFSNIMMNYAISASSTKGAKYNIFSYSTNGGSTWNNLTRAMDTFNIGGVYRPDTLQMINPVTAVSDWYPVHIDFSSDPNVNNNPNFILRWEFEGTSSNGTSGNDRYDNFSILGNTSNEVCNGDNGVSATVGTKYGVQPYTYSWSPSGGSNVTATGLSAGTYTVNTSDANGCTGSVSITITQPLAITPSITPIEVGCNGQTNGSATASATGGNSPYMYQWSPGGQTTATITGLSAGTYTVSVTDHTLCSAATIITISQPATLTAGTSMTAATCNTVNGTATATPSGGTSPYTYAWQGSQTNATATGLAAADYSVTVTDNNGCSATGTINVTSTGENATASTTTNINCNGSSTGSVGSSVIGGATPYTYLWSPGSFATATVGSLAAGTYTLNVTDHNGCTSSSTTTITQPALLKDSLMASGVPVVLHYWDFNQTFPAGGAGGDSLGSVYSYANNYTTDTTNSTAPLYAPYTVVSGGARIIYSRPSTIQGTAASLDGILDNGSQGSFINDLNSMSAINTALGNDTATNVLNNLFVRSRNPELNSYFYLYLPTTGYQNIQINYAIQESSAKGAQFNILSYSTNGGSTWNNLPRSVDTFSVGHQPTPDTLTVNGDANWTPYNLNFSKVSAVNNNPNFMLRWTYAGSQATGSSGNDRYDNISVIGNAVEEYCHGDNNVDIAAGIAGGTAPYTYTWSPNVSTTASANNVSAGTYSVTVTDHNGCSKVASITITQPAVLATTPTGVNIVCGGTSTGSTAANATGGTSPYNYVWTPGGQTTANLSEISAGAYRVSVKDINGCSATASITLTQPATVHDSVVTQSNINCNGGTSGSATVGARYGISPYTYSWNPTSKTTASATALTAGIYTVTITDNHGCGTPVLVNITQPGVISDSIVSLIQPACAGQKGTITIGLTGGTAPYTYEWSNGTNSTNNFISLVADPYTVTVRDKYNCSNTAITFTVSQPVGMRDTITTAATVNLLCNGVNTGSATVGVKYGAAPYTYAWTPSGQTNATAIGLSAGTYSISLTDANGCSSTVVRTVVITQPATAVRDSVTTTTAASCNGGTGSGSIGIKGGTSPYTYLWTPSGKTTATATGLLAGVYTVTATDVHGCGAPQLVTITQPSIVRDSAVSVTQLASCNSYGSATIGVTGGTPGYSYSWSPGGYSLATITTLSPGTYTVTVSDNKGCSGTSVNFTINQKGSVRDSITAITQVACNGSYTGSITVGAARGAAPYTYLWSPGGQTNATAIGLSIGTYSVNVTDNGGCSGLVVTATLTQPTAIHDSITAVTQIKCNGASTGSATLGLKGGVTPYTYNWSNGLSTVSTSNPTGAVLTAGNYTVTVTDNHGCSATTGVLLTQPIAIRDSVVIQSNINCHGGISGSATVGVKSGVSPYTYSWSPITNTTVSAASLSAGIYTVSITDNHGCGTPVLVNITQPGVISDSISSLIQPACAGQKGTVTIGLTGGTAPYTYEWSNGTNSTNNFISLVADPYTVTVRDKYNCSNTAITFTVSQPVGMRDTITTAATVNLLCNGVNTGSATVGVKYGAAPYTYAWTPSGQTNATAIGLSAGTYSISLTDANGCSSTVVRTVVITQPATAVRDSVTTTTAASCNGGTGSGSIGIKGGTSPYTYLWTPSGKTTATATGLLAGVYTVTATDVHGCGAPQLVTITQPSIVRDSAVSVTQLASCNSYGSATIGVTGGTPGYSYSWSPGGYSLATITTLSPGTYTVTVSDNKGCSGTSVNFTINQKGSVRDSITAITQVACNGSYTGSITVGAARGAAPYTYLWSPGGQTNATAIGLSIGTYSVNVTDNGGCSGLVVTATLTQPTAIHDSITAVTQIKCNGASTGSATLGIKGGVTPYTYNWSNGLSTVSTSNPTGAVLTAGNYTVTITDHIGCSHTAGVSVTQPLVAIRDSVASLAYPICNGTEGIATIGVKGGISPYTYAWSPYTNTTATSSTLTARTYTVTVKDYNGCSASTSFNVTQPIAIRDSIITKNNGCYLANNAYITTGVKNGVAPYTYTWNPSVSSASSASNLAPGTYSVTITDNNGCAKTLSAVITQPTQLRDSITSITNLGCYGGTQGQAIVGYKGGAGTYTYLWTPSARKLPTATGLTAGSYSVTVTDLNGCSVSASTTLTQSAAIRDSLVSGSIISPTCYGGSNGAATIGIVGGTGPYTFVWAPAEGSTATINTLKAGVYTVTVRDAHLCANTAVTLTVHNPLAIHDTIVKASTTYPRCNGGVGSAMAGAKYGTAPYTYLWNPGAQTNANAVGLTAGTYTASITDINGCTSTSATISITQPKAIRDSIVTWSCNGANGSATVGILNGVSPFTYTWSPGGGTKSAMTGLTASSYTVTITDHNGCAGPTVDQTFDCSEAPARDGAPASGLTDINLYPNPSNGEFTINGLTEGQILEMYDYTGRLIKNVTVDKQEMQLNIADQPNGMYLVIIVNKDGTLASQKKVVKVQ